jgi:hypothetical protein
LGDATGKTGTSQKNIFYKMVNALVPPYLSAMVRLWNSEPTSIRDSRSPSSLKSYYKSKCIKKPIYYCAGTGIGQIFHMRLRTVCSSLSHHLFLTMSWITEELEEQDRLPFYKKKYVLVMFPSCLWRLPTRLFI